MDELSKLFAQMEAQETRLLGIAHCIIPKEEEAPIIESDLVPPPSPPISESIKPIEKDVSQTLTEPQDPTPEIVPEEIVPERLLPVEMEHSIDTPIIDSKTNSLNNPSDVPSLLTSLANSAAVVTEQSIITEIIDTPTIATTTTTEIPIPNPDENNIEIVTHTEHTEKSSVLTTVTVATMLSSIENDTVINSLNYINKLENVTVLDGTPSTNLKSSVSQTENLEMPTTSSTSSPSSIAEIVLGEMESISESPEPDNYIYETFSPISPVDIGEVSSLQRNEHLVIAEEPPEILNDAVSAA